MTTIFVRCTRIWQGRSRLSSGRNQGITAMPGRWIEAGRAPAFSVKAGQKAMPVNSSDGDPKKARRFRDAALPHLDDVYTLARYLLRDAADAEEAVEECYLRRLRNFATYRRRAMKPGR